MSYDYAACKRSIKCLFGLGAHGKIKYLEQFRTGRAQVESKLITIAPKLQKTASVTSTALSENIKSFGSFGLILCEKSGLNCWAAEDMLWRLLNIRAVWAMICVASSSVS
ncbi:hypothetical protein TNCV_4989401 [Trichonephila clavipes]|uniref:Uncharacterized protein n=1 Tax=Trichonephila clavipes TaxID=2585209 RepID=A0A8X7BH11_TRICX|nr:hypothetical protein TNCV_4989401 [Trichonephila clavipes]